MLNLTEEVIAALERECVLGLLSADDDKAILQCLAPNFTCVTSVDGPQFRIESREAWVERWRSNATLRIDDVAVALHGAVAIATVLATQGAKEETPIEWVFLDVWITEDGGWRLAERHESRPIPR